MVSSLQTAADFSTGSPLLSARKLECLTAHLAGGVKNSQLWTLETN
jgi:hypothetical protein